MMKEEREDGELLREPHQGRKGEKSKSMSWTKYTTEKQREKRWAERERELSQDASSNNSPISDDKRILFVSHLKDHTKEEVYNFFEPFARVRAVRLIVDSNSLRSKGYAFVEFESSKDATYVLEQTRKMNLSFRVELARGPRGESDTEYRLQRYRPPLLGRDSPQRQPRGDFHIHSMRERVSKRPRSWDSDNIVRKRARIPSPRPVRHAHFDHYAPPPLRRPSSPRHMSSSRFPLSRGDFSAPDNRVARRRTSSQEYDHYEPSYKLTDKSSIKDDKS